MIYLLRGLYERLRQPIDPNPYHHPTPVGQWWFDSENPIDWGPALATVAEHHGDDAVDDDDDDGEPYPADTGSKRPRCKTCGGPNFSPENEVCIICRLGM